jgi:hypothetical protein
LCASALVAGCGGGSSGASAAQPSWDAVKRLALKTPPLAGCSGVKEIAVDNPGQGGGPKFAVGHALRCGSAPPDVGYRAYDKPEDAQKFIDDLELAKAPDPYFVNHGVVVFIVEQGGGKPSPLADRIKQDCGCGSVVPAGR